MGDGLWEMDLVWRFGWEWVGIGGSRWWKIACGPGIWVMGSEGLYGLGAGVYGRGTE